MTLADLTLLQARKGLLDKKFSAVELLGDCLLNLEKNRKLNAYITETIELAKNRAKDSDERIARNQVRKLDGIPFAVKDVFCTNGVRTTVGSRILENFVPLYESTYSQKLDEEGYVMVGKTNCAEFCADGNNKTSYFGAVINPYKAKDDARDLVPGGSSGGSVVALATNTCLASAGTDTGGSIRQPAAYTNLVGLRATYGRISRYGMIAYASSLDQAGFFTKDVRDMAYIAPIVFGKDDKDSTSANAPIPDLLQNLNSDINGKKIGIVKGFKKYIDNDIEKDIAKNYYDCLENFKKFGADLIEVDLPTLEVMDILYQSISYVELMSNLGRYDGIRYGRRTEQDCKTLNELYIKSRTEGFGENIKKRILIGAFLSSSENYEKYFLKSLKIKRKIANEYNEAFKKVDVIFNPAVSRFAFPINPTIEENEILGRQGTIEDYFLNGINQVGLPGITVPTGFGSNGLPIGMTFTGKLFDEQSLLNFSLFLEENK
ncbi:MAG: aspartyl/glutamyl-tRNA amidotransferase subunit A [Rickettsiales bacterium]|jgi:aspartyl-tRNA(Asn)/glutamyl-tRNA(Gln) amidotransferase subunit A|nr:aspartyl/glutamyl-tRNA amidotransferase subunit A [Rickettsiales bacterium]